MMNIWVRLREVEELLHHIIPPPERTCLPAPSFTLAGSRRARISPGPSAFGGGSSGEIQTFLFCFGSFTTEKCFISIAPAM